MREARAAAGALSRRAATLAALAATTSPWFSPVAARAAEKDCYTDCIQNCNRVAPKSGRYCESSCNEYCAQDDRRDGLSGSIDSSNAEVGLLSAFDLGSKVSGKAPVGVPYGEDRPPALSLGAFDSMLREAVGTGR